ncbi:hypothetical protein [Pontimicrobium sp. SW4]|uniref:Signal peptidase II n=1 Tax=Pontimicrobium sp. SW4 TaxID=3153519 RepID=A0AAU7BTL9_9FLAO
MKNEIPESGVYHYPGLPKNQSQIEIDKIKNKLKQDPRITLMVYVKEPTQLFNSKTFVFSLLINLVTVIFSIFIISRMTIKNRKNIFSVTLFLGLLTVIMSDISLMNWFMFPASYTLVNAFDKIVSFGLLGLLFTFYTFKNRNHA